MFFLNQQLLEQNIIQILVHGSKFLSERGSRTSRFVAGKGSPGEMLQTSICIHLPLGCRSATGFIWSAAVIPMELRVHRDMTGFNIGVSIPKNGVFTVENPSKMDDFGTPILGSPHFCFNMISRFLPQDFDHLGWENRLKRVAGVAGIRSPIIPRNPLLWEATLELGGKGRAAKLGGQSGSMD